MREPFEGYRHPEVVCRLAGKDVVNLISTLETDRTECQRLSDMNVISTLETDRAERQGLSDRNVIFTLETDRTECQSLSAIWAQPPTNISNERVST